MTRHRPTINDVARRAGVSKSAVSFTLNGREGVSDATRSRIHAAVRELGWQPSVRARALSNARAYALGVVLNRPAYLIASDPFYAGFIAGVESVMSRHDHSLLLRVVDDGGDAAQSAHRTLWSAGRVDGFLVLDLERGDRRLATVVERRIPVLAVGVPDRDDVPWVAVDDRTGLSDALRHLIALGHRRIAHVSGPPRYMHATTRRDLWANELARAGLPEGPLASGDFSAAGGAKATQELLDGGCRFTAIVYANDLMALAGMQVMRQAGIGVPDDVSVVGFDDIHTAELSVPTLTTVRQDAQRWGAEAARAFLARLDGGRAPTGWVGHSELVVRGSTGPAPRRDPT